MVTSEQIREAMHARPFLPFKLYLVGGQSYTVRHPDFIAVPPTPQGSNVAVNDAKGSHLIDLSRIDRIDLKTPPNSNAELI